MMSARRRNRTGNALLEFTLVGIPLLFVLISIFEIARGMWTYHTLAHAVRAGTRFAVVHGSNCNPALNNANNCLATIQNVATVIRDAGVGLIPTDLTVTRMEIAAAGVTLYSVPGSPRTLDTLLTDLGNFPPASNLSAVGNDVVITATYPFRSAIALFWPGAGPGIQFGVFNLPASSREKIQF